MKPFLQRTGIRTFGYNQPGRDGGEAEPSPPQRIEPRYKTSRRIRLIADGQESNFALQNVSANGAAGVTDCPLTADQQIRLVFEGREEVVGIVRWTRDNMAGIQFVEPISPQLVQGPGSASLPERAPRYKVARSATIQGEFPPCAAVIRNISTRGMLIESRQPLRIGQDLEIRCGRMMPMSAQVRWVNGGQAGLLLLMPIALDEFEQQTSDAVL